VPRPGFIIIPDQEMMMQPGTAIEAAWKWRRFHYLTTDGSDLIGLYFRCIVFLVQVVFSFLGRADIPAQTLSGTHRPRYIANRAISSSSACKCRERVVHDEHLISDLHGYQFTV
jgi:hypothetical protein